MIEEVHPLKNNLIHSFRPLGTSIFFLLYRMLKSIYICYHFCSSGYAFSMMLRLVSAEESTRFIFSDIFQIALHNT